MKRYSYSRELITFVEAKWLKTKCALRLSEEMHNRVQKYVDENLQEVQMFDY